MFRIESSSVFETNFNGMMQARKSGRMIDAICGGDGLTWFVRMAGFIHYSGEGGYDLNVTSSEQPDVCPYCGTYNGPRGEYRNGFDCAGCGSN